MELEGKYKPYIISNGEFIPRQEDCNKDDANINKKNNNIGNNSAGGGHGHGVPSGRPTNYGETLMHLLKGNVGSGVFAMGDAFRNAGLLLSPIFTLILGAICVHCQHILLKCSKKMKKRLQLDRYPDFAETVELSFRHGPKSLQKFSKNIKHLVNMFLCLTQLGFGCVYIVFISTNVKQVADFYDYDIDLHLHMFFVLIPILLLSLIPNLKLLAPFSTFANFCMAAGIGVVFYYTFTDIPSPSERNLVGELQTFPLYFGTAIYAFEGIALVLPLKNSIKGGANFNNCYGVLNVGMIFVVLLYTSFGFFGYLKWGEEVKGSLTLNLPQEDILAQIVKLTVCLGMLLTYPLQFYVAAEILWNYIIENHGPFNKNALTLHLLFRTFLVIVTFIVAELVPELGLFISLIGALCATALALVFPPLVQLILTWSVSKKPNKFVLVKNLLILIIALFGFATGTYQSLSNIISTFFHQSS